MKKIILTLILFTAIKSFSQKATSVDADATASYVPPNYIMDKNEEFQISTGAFFFDATKRMGISNVVKNGDGTFTFKYLGEEQPDAIYETLKEFLGNVTADIKGKVTVDASVESMVEKLVTTLTNKSNSLNFLRTSLYRLNETAFNGDIDSESYAKLYEIIIKTSAELQKQELISELKTETETKKEREEIDVENK